MMKLNSLAIIPLVIAISACNDTGETSSIVKKEIYSVDMVEDTSLSLSMYDYVTVQMQSLDIVKSSSKVQVEFDKDKNGLDIVPRLDQTGLAEVEFKGKDINGQNRVLVYKLNIQPINDPVRATENNVAIKYKGLSIFDSLIDIIDVDSDINSLSIDIVQNDSKFPMSLQGTDVYFTPQEIGLNKTATYVLKTVEDGKEKLATLTYNFLYENNTIEKTPDSHTYISMLEDQRYSGKIAPIKESDTQVIDIIYDVSNTIGEIVRTSNEKYDYYPPANFNGNDSFSVTFKNAAGDETTYEININVQSVLDDMSHDNIEFMIQEDTTLMLEFDIIDVEKNKNYEYSLGTASSNSSVVFTESGFNYIPNENYYGIDSFSINVNDTINNRILTIPVTANVIAIEDPLAIEDKSIEIIRGAIYSEQFTFYDPEQSTADYNFVVRQPSEGSVVIDQSGNYTYTSNPSGSLTTDSFEIIVMDGNNKRNDSAIVTVNIVDNSIGVQTLSVNEDEDVRNIELKGIIESQKDNYTVSVLSSPGNGSVTVNSDKTFNYSPNVNYNGIDTFTINYIDSVSGFVGQIDYEVTITPVEDEWLLDEIVNYHVIQEDGVLTMDLSVADIEFESPTIYSVVQEAENGQVVIDSNGTLTYTPDANFNGKISFIVGFESQTGQLSAQKKIDVTITPVDDGFSWVEYNGSPLPLPVMPTSANYSIDLSNYLENGDASEGFIFLGDIKNQNGDWDINQNSNLTATISENGIINVIPKATSTSGIKTIPFRIRESLTGNVHDMEFDIRVEDSLNVINASDEIKFIDQIGAIENQAFYLCAGEYTIDSDVVMPKGLTLHGYESDLAEQYAKDFPEENGYDTNFDINYNCITEDVITSIVVDGKIFELDDNTLLNGLTLSRTSKDIPLITFTGLTENIKLKNITATDNNELEQTTSLIKADKLKNFSLRDSDISASRLLDITLIDVNEASGIYDIENNVMVGATNAVKIEKIRQNSGYVSQKRQANILFNRNTVSDVDFGLVLRTIYIDDDFNVIYSIMGNNITADDTAIQIESTANFMQLNKNHILIGSKNYIQPTTGEEIIYENTINAKKYGIKVYNGLTPLSRANIDIKNNTITTKENAGIYIEDSYMASADTTASGLDMSGRLIIKDNKIDAIESHFNQDHVGVYYTYKIMNQNSVAAGTVNSLTYNKFSDITIEGNEIGLNSEEKYQESALKIRKNNSMTQLTNTGLFQIGLLVKDNTFNGFKDVIIDQNGGFNQKREILNIDFLNNELMASYPKEAFSINENYSDICLRFMGNTVDHMEMENGDNNSDLSIADMEGNGYDIFYGNHNNIESVYVNGVIFDNTKASCL